MKKRHCVCCSGRALLGQEGGTIDTVCVVCRGGVCYGRECGGQMCCAEAGVGSGTAGRGTGRGLVQGKAGRQGRSTRAGVTWRQQGPITAGWPGFWTEYMHTYIHTHTLSTGWACNSMQQGASGHMVQP